MTAAAKLAGFALALGVVFVAATLAGAAVDPAPRDDAEPAAAHGGDMAEDHEAPAQPVRGLAVSEHGLRLDLQTTELEPGAPSELRFRILDAAGAPVRAFDVEHERRMHLIVVRRDMRGFQHLHPRMSADGTWSVPIRLPDAGTYRVLADFSHDETASTLGADLRVSGDAQLRELPAPATSTETTGGLRVALDAPPLRAGREADLRFTVTQDGRTVTPEPYLGARGHLVVLREGDLAFLHVHPMDDGGATFAATFPSPGRYRLFLQVKVDGDVRTAAYTVEVPR